MLNDKAKDAIKIGLAFVLVYYIALQASWMNPYWAGLAVVVCALPTAGQSIQKGLSRLLGTLPGCAVGLIIMALALQNRVLFALLTCAWLFLTTLMMLRSKHHAYFWNMAGLVAIIIAAGGAGLSEGLFERATFRTLETGLGILAYTLVTVFLWPRTNAGAIRKTGGDLIAAQQKLFRATADAMAGKTPEEGLPVLHAEEVKQLGAFDRALQAEGSESWEVHELRPGLERIQRLAAAVMESLDRWQTSLVELTGLDPERVIPALPALRAELEARFAAVRRLFAGQPSEYEPQPVPFQVDKAAMAGASHFERAALALIVKELGSLESLTADMLRSARGLAGEPAESGPVATVTPTDASGSSWRLPVIDKDHLRGALFVVTAFLAGFLIWILFDPPGHATWAILGASLGISIAQTQQARAIIVIKPFALMLALGLLVYVFVLPRLSTFAGLGSVLFLLMFINNYVFTGVLRLPGNMAIINMISIQNHQQYFFAAMANAYVFTLLVVIFIYCLSYLLRSPRPEKAVLALLRRYFRSAEFLVANLALESEAPSGPIGRWKVDFHRHELKTLPAKIGGWCHAIDSGLFPANSGQQVDALVGSLQALDYRIEELLEAADAPHGRRLARALGDDLKIWRDAVANRFGQWSASDGGEPAPGLKEQLATWLDGLEQHIGAAFGQPGTEQLGEQDGEGALRLLGSFRGVSNAAVAYADAADAIDWDDWRKEVFR